MLHPVPNVGALHAVPIQISMERAQHAAPLRGEPNYSETQHDPTYAVTTPADHYENPARSAGGLPVGS
ncbi:hypothetical protein D3C76_1543700 [compost metagenome]